MKFWRLLPASAWLLFALCWPSYGQEPAPLTDQELQEIQARLGELMVARAELAVLHRHLEQRDAVDARERAAWERSLEAERRMIAATEKERDLQQERAAFYEAALKAATRKRGLACRIGKIVSLGLVRCN